MTTFRASRFTPEYVEWRKAVLLRDKGVCVECGEKGATHAHHILHYASHPELRYVVDNGLTLCRCCHSDKHPERRDAIRYYRHNRRT